MSNQYTPDQLLNFFIRDRAAGWSSIDEDISFLGGDDEWLFDELSKYLNTLSTKDFLEILRIVSERTKQRYFKCAGWGHVVFIIISEILALRPTKYSHDKYPEEGVALLMLTNNEEQQLIDFLLSIKNDIDKNNQYRVYALIRDITGKWVGKDDPYAP